MKKSELKRIIKEQYDKMNKSKAIFMAGPAGSGKSTILRTLGLKGYNVINVDDEFESLLKSTLGTSNFASMTPDQLSTSGKLMSQARKSTKEKESKLVGDLQNIIIDGVGASSKMLLKKKEELEALGYDTFMILIHVSPMVSLERNAKRGRSLPTSAVLKSWESVTKNIDIYKSAFGDNFVAIDNNPEDANKSFSPKEIMRLYPQPKGKPKSPEEMEKRRKQKEETNKNIQYLLQIDKQFDNLDVLNSKINLFIK